MDALSFILVVGKRKLLKEYIDKVSLHNHIIKMEDNHLSKGCNTVIGTVLLVVISLTIWLLNHNQKKLYR
jgi:hypothetical protein